MWLADFSLHSESQDKKAYIPALIGAGICLLLLRSGILSFFFLVPLGFLASRYEQKIAWAASLLAILGNAILLISEAMPQGFPSAAIIWNFLYFAAMVFIFAWITVPPPAVAEKVSLSVRIVTGCCLGALAFIGLFLRIMATPGFSDYVSNLMNALTLQNARFDTMPADIILQGITNVILRGGSLVACVLLFTFCRQMGLVLARVIPGKSINSTETPGMYFQRVNSLIAFRVEPLMIWVFSASLLLVVFTRIAAFEIPEIILWNILTLCAILYLAQGLGILQFFLAKSSISPFLKLLILVLFFVLLFSPFLNGVLLVGLVLLGIAENWAPLRAPKQNSQPSTPEGE